METDEMEMEDDSKPPSQVSPPEPQPQVTEIPSPPQPEEPELPPVPPPDTKLRILKEPIKHVEAKKNIMMQVCPRCGQKVPMHEMGEHMRIELLDPKYSENKRILAERAKDTALADSDEISKHLHKWAERRTDVMGDQEVEIGKRIGEDDKKAPEKVTWDGHTASIGRTTSAVMSGMTLDDQIAAIHASKGLAPTKVEGEKPSIGPQAPDQTKPTPSQPPALRAPLITVVPGLPSVPRPVLAPMVPGMLPTPLMMSGMMMPGMMPPPYGMFPPPPMMHQPPPPEDEPSTKRQKTEQELNLIPEAEFVAAHPDPVKIIIQVPPAPTTEKNEWNFQGHQLEFSMEMQHTVQNIKEKIKEALGMPPNKQKLKAPGISILKDANTLGFYNITPGTVISLGVKERGGRKK